MDLRNPSAVFRQDSQAFFSLGETKLPVSYDDVQDWCQFNMVIRAQMGKQDRILVQFTHPCATVRSVP